MSSGVGREAWKLAFELSPIILTGGMAKNLPGNMLPIIALTEAINFPLGLLSSGGQINPESFFAHYLPMPGGSLIKQDLARYPFANQAVAANSVIAQPLHISLLMVAPAKGTLGYIAKLASMTALRATLNYHNNNGGLYTVATPSFFYTNCIMLDMSDAGSGQSRQPQITWRLDFEKPLVTLDDAEGAQNSLFAKLESATPLKEPGGSIWSNLNNAVGQSSGQGGPATIPAQSGVAGSGQPGGSSIGPIY